MVKSSNNPLLVPDDQNNAMMFLILCIAIGVAVRCLCRRTVSAGTVILILFGLAVGALSNAIPPVRDFTAVLTNMHMDWPHPLIYYLLPIGIFQSALTMNVHKFKKTLAQCLMLAGPVMLICAGMTAVVGRYVFHYNWPWMICLLFGTILSATDPVAVVNLLKDPGASKRLSTVIEGESLLNNGVVFVFFNVLLRELLPNVDQSGVDICWYLLRVIVVSPLIGWILGKLTVCHLSHALNHVESILTVATVYLAYFVSEVCFEVSGVLAVLTMAIVISSHRSCISPEVTETMHFTWDCLAFGAHTMTFILVGVVFAQQAFLVAELLDWLYLVVLYFSLNFIRLIIVLSATPLLSKFGYDLTWKHAVVISWGGLRGAVGLVPAMVVVQEGISHSAPLQVIGRHFLFYTAGVVFLTLLVNGSTTGLLLCILGMTDMSEPPVKKFLRVQKAQRLREPRVPSAEEFAEEIRVRTIELEKMSYSRQRKKGLLGRYASDKLRAIADIALDTPKRLILMEDIEEDWRISKLLMMLHSFTEKVHRWKTSTKPPAPVSKFLKKLYCLSTSAVMEAIIMVILVVNTVVNLVITDYPKLALDLQKTNYFFVALYILEAVMKMLGLRKYYWHSIWNIFDFGITILFIAEVVVIDVAISSISSIRILWILIAGRMIGRLLKLLLDRRIISDELKFAYDIAKGLMVAKLAMLSKLDKLDFAGKEILQEHRSLSEDAIEEVKRRLRELQKNIPDVQCSVSTISMPSSRDTLPETAIVMDEEISLSSCVSTCSSLSSISTDEEFWGEVDGDYSASSITTNTPGTTATLPETVIVMDEENSLPSCVSTSSSESSIATDEEFRGEVDSKYSASSITTYAPGTAMPPETQVVVMHG